MLKAVLTVAMAILGVIMVMPFIWMLSSSLKQEAQVFSYPFRWIPDVLSWANYREVWFGSVPFSVFYKNSIVVALLRVGGQIVVSSLAAYAFARMQFKGRDAIFLLYLATMMVPPQVTLVPKFIVFDWLGLIDTHWTLILPGIFNPFGVFLLRQFFVSIPTDLSESAKIDGASDFRIWRSIIMPLAKPALVTLSILFFVWTWNDYQNPLIFLSTKSKFTIPVGLHYFMDEIGARYSLVMAGAVSATIPVILLYFMAQRYIIENIATSGIKG